MITKLIKCVHCDEVFDPHTTYGGTPFHRTRKYCSKTCARVEERIHKEALGSAAMDFGERHCDECDAEFPAGYSWNKRFCGALCRKRWRKRQENSLLREKRGLSYTWGVVPCAYCGIEFDNRQPYVGGTNPKVPRTFCSVACRKRRDTVGKDRTRRLAAYGLTPHDFDALLESQRGLCAICRRPERQERRHVGGLLPLHVDHDHDTGVVRGLLCSACNTALGLLGESPDRVMAALAYLLAQSEVRERLNL